MRYHEILMEAKVHQLDGEKVWENPSKTDIRALLKRIPHLRGWVTQEDKVFVWNAHNDTHSSMEWNLVRAGLIKTVGMNIEFIIAMDGQDFDDDEFSGWPGEVMRSNGLIFMLNGAARQYPSFRRML